MLIYFLKEILIMNLWFELMITLIVSGLIYVLLLFFFRVLKIEEIKNFIRTLR